MKDSRKVVCVYPVNVGASPRLCPTGGTVARALRRLPGTFTLRRSSLLAFSVAVFMCVLSVWALFCASFGDADIPNLTDACPITACNLTAYCAARGGAGIAFAYNNKGMQDGAGSQLHRVVLTLALSRAVSAGYVHAGIISLDLHGDPASIIHDWNALMHLRDRDNIPDLKCQAQGDGGGEWFSPLLFRTFDGCVHGRMGHKIIWNDVLNQVNRLCQPSSMSRREAPRVLLHLGAAELFDSAPELFTRSAARFSDEYAWLRTKHDGDGDAKKAIAGTTTTTTPSCGDRKTLDVAVHVRRGDIVATHRKIPNEYFVGMARALVVAARAAALPPLKISFFMDAVTDEAHKSTLNLDDFTSVENAELFYGGSALDTFKTLARADVLVMSRSSFSFLPALLHDADHGAVIYHPMWHAPRADWFVSEEYTNQGGMGKNTHARLVAFLNTRRAALCGATQ